MKVASVKGMADLLPGGDVEAFQLLEARSREVLRRYGYGEVRTPVLEETALFVRGVGEGTDIVGKEMYTFEDKGGRSLSLRPEATAGLVRAYVEHSISNQEPLTRWFCFGPMFRYERMKTGRYRQFYQLDVEAFGARGPAQDAEVIEVALEILRAVELKGVRLEINSIGDKECRPAYQQQLVAYFTGFKDQLCAECQARLERNPLRILDCKNEKCREIARGAPKMLDHLCPPCRQHFDEVQRLLRLVGVEFTVNAWIVRGLDYYVRTAFELIADDPVLGTASAVGGGGRYDGLVQSLGGPDVPGVGFALGADRLKLLMQGRALAQAPDLFVASVDDQSFDAAFALASKLRKDELWVETDTRGGSLKSQMKRADKSGARFVLVVGEREVAEQAGELKPLRGGEPRRVSFAELPGILRPSR
ncbi:MAG TPA: histidine--tRNA ligase [Myxococcaceae bacterium]|nr:histidine--tRNA ligase [Myxococcaceae bacterium]